MKLECEVVDFDNVFVLKISFQNRKHDYKLDIKSLNNKYLTILKLI